MTKTQLEFTPKERYFLQRILKRALDTTEGDPAEMRVLQAAKSLVNSLESLASLRMAWAEVLDDELEGPRLGMRINHPPFNTVMR